MGDSDDDHDKRGRRDKFRGERNDYDNRRPMPRGYDRGGRGGDRGWQDRKRDYNYGNRDNNYGNRDNRDRRDFGGRSPPSKRNKPDWEDNQWNRGGGESNTMIPAEKQNTGSPNLMSFKDFVTQQEDDINEEEAVRRYQEYKVEFKRTQINDFFVMKKKEEWFEEKYHPTKGVERKRFIRNSMRKRLRVFLDLWEEGYIDKLDLQISESTTVLKLLDRVVITLEGGTEEDLKVLDEPPKAIEGKSSPTQAVKEEPKDTNKDTDTKPKNDDKPGDYTYDADATEEDDEGIGKEPLPPGMDEDDDLKPPGEEDEDKEKEEKTEEVKKEEEEEEEEKKEEIPKEYVYEGAWPNRPVSIFIRNASSNIVRNDIIAVCKPYPGFLRVAMSDAAPERRYSRRVWVTFGPETNIKDVCWNLSNIRVKEMELSPSVNRDVTNRVRPINGIACAPMAMQMDISYAIEMIKKLDKRIKLYEKEEDLTEDEDEEDDDEDGGDEDGDGDDEKAKNGHNNGDGDEEGEEKEEKEDGEDDEKKSKKSSIKKVKLEKVDVPDENPVLKSLPLDIHHTVTGMGLTEDEEDSKEHPITVNESLMKNLDLVLLYLRVVHCIDFYNANEYHYEDEMPMRCGIMHVRAQPLVSGNKKDVHEYFKANKAKLDQISVEDKEATDEEAAKFGKKNEETEVDNFIKANTQELAKDKWLCPLSGKKFRGPEFVRKHIMMKHGESVDNVRTEVKYFNNYVYDMKRPCFPESRGGAGGKNDHSGGNQYHQRSNTGGAWQRPPMNTPKSNYQSQNNYSTPQMQNVQQETYGRVNTYPPKGMNRRGGGFRDRKVIRYRDLDAPEESDFF